MSQPDLPGQKVDDAADVNFHWMSKAYQLNGPGPTYVWAIDNSVCNEAEKPLVLKWERADFSNYSHLPLKKGMAMVSRISVGFDRPQVEGNVPLVFGLNSGKTDSSIYVRARTKVASTGDAKSIIEQGQLLYSQLSITETIANVMRTKFSVRTTAVFKDGEGRFEMNLEGLPLNYRVGFALGGDVDQAAEQGMQVTPLVNVSDDREFIQAVNAKQLLAVSDRGRELKSLTFKLRGAPIIQVSEVFVFNEAGRPVARAPFAFFGNSFQ
ncbi:hypothetical protein ACO2RV_12655 [Ancylobacter sp. VNQ12]|uniref:hypothetical protein n=1 Tax=Ancylobacter sp. VNQ12 TaxID=3400920 RepID=UPI003C057ADA